MEEKPSDPTPSSEAHSDAPLTIAEPVEAEVPAPVAEDEAEAGAQSAEFAAMLESSLKANPAREPREAKVGDKVKGKIVSLSEDSAFVDFGGRAEGALPIGALKDSEGNLKVKEGDPIEATIASLDGQITLQLAVRRQDAGLAILMKAKDEGTPVEGKIKGTNSGGFEVILGGIRGFCPFSQMDLGPVGDGQQFIGQVHHFKVLDVSEKGRRVVLSRKALLKNERVHQADAIRGKLEPGQVLDGVVTRLLPFGAFVDVGGVQGLVHVSEISHKRVGDPSEALTVSQKVQVKVLKLEHLGEGKKERISLSIKAAEADPWTTLEGRLKEGDVVKGPVLRVMAATGILSQLLPGALQLPRLERLIELEAEQGFPPHPVLRLAALLPDSEAAAQACADRLRLSNADRVRLQQALGGERIAQRLSAAEARRSLYRLGEARFRDKILLHWAGEPASSGAWRMLLEMAERWQPPRFPLTGRDVMQAGIAEGPDVGRVLGALQDWWVEGDFTADEAALRDRLKNLAGRV